MDLIQLIDYFVRSGQIAGKSPAKSAWSQVRLAAFAGFLQESGHSMRIAQLKQADAERYIAHLMSRTARWEKHPDHKPDESHDLSRSTIQGHVRALRALSAWAAKQRYLQEDVFHGVPVSKLPKTLYEILSEEEIARVRRFSFKRRAWWMGWRQSRI